MGLIIIAICTFVAIVIALFSGLITETYQWNKGICRDCGQKLLFFNFAHTGERIYKCKNCCHAIWIKYNYVDKRRK